MKNLFLSAIFAVLAFTGNAQTITIKVSEYQLSAFTDTSFTQTDFIPITVTYIFDVDNKIITICDKDEIVLEFENVTVTELIDINNNRFVEFKYVKFDSVKQLKVEYTFEIDPTTKKISNLREQSLTESLFYTFN